MTDKAELRQALHNMGYRPMRAKADNVSEIWGKPMAYSLLLFDMDELRWDQRFDGKDSNDEWGMSIYASDTWDPETGNFLQWLANVERYQFHHVVGKGQIFDFRTQLVGIL